MARVRTQLKRTSDGRTIPAALEDALPRAALFDTEAEWCRERVEIARQLDAAGFDPGDDEWPGSWHWSWVRKAIALPSTRFGTAGDARLIGIRADRHWQGSLLCYHGSRFSRSTPRPAPLVYVDFIEVAPWNWDVRTIGQIAGFRGVGTLLMGAAVRTSLSLGYDGRIGLHSLAQAEPFYAGRCGMRNLGADARYHGLSYFEMTAAQAAAFLQRQP